MIHRHRGWIALVATLLLLVAQQAAQWHMAGHLGERIGAAHADSVADGAGHGVDATGEDDAHHGAESLLHLCAGCLSLAGLEMPLASAPPPRGGASVPPHAAPDAVPPRLTFGFPAAYRSRAPPRLHA